MIDYISRDSVLALVQDSREVCANPTKELAFIREDIFALPAADVREVVLCKDCKHSAHDWQGNRYCGLVKTYNTVDGDWFCADGERLTNCGAQMEEQT